MTNEILLEVENLSRERKPKLAQLTFTLSAGESLALVGPNGVGKTSLLKCILGLLDYQGKVSIEGKDFSAFSRKEIAQKIAYLPQVPESDCFLSVAQYLDLSFFAQVPPLFSRKKEAINLFGLENFLLQSFNTLSGGERQRVLMACAYCQNPKIYLLDEPFASLDLSSTNELLSTLELIKKSGCAILIALHDLNLVSSCADRVLQVGQGKLVSVESYRSGIIFNPSVL